MNTFYIILAFIIATSIGIWVYWSDKRKNIPYPSITAILRTLLFLGVLLLLLPLSFDKSTITTHKPTIVLLEDNSSSIKTALGADSTIYKKNILSLINQLSEKYNVSLRDLDGLLQKDSIAIFNKSFSNLSTPFEQISEDFSQNNLSAIVVISDGWYNEGSNPSYIKIPLNTSLYCIAIGDTQIIKDIRILKAYANKTNILNTDWEVNIDILAKGYNGQTAIIQLLDEHKQIINQQNIFITQNEFDTRAKMSIKTTKQGMQQYTLKILPQPNELNTHNNIASLLVNVIEDKKKILLLYAAPHPDIKTIKEAVKGYPNFEIISKSISEAPSNLNEYSAIIAHQVPTLISKQLPINYFQHSNVWYILGYNTNYSMLNMIQKENYFNEIPVKYKKPIFNKSFNLFNVPININEVCAKLPPLSINSTYSSTASTYQNLFVDEQGLPIWSFYSHNNKSTSILYGDGLWRWYMYEYKNMQNHKNIDECISQTLQFITNNNKDKILTAEPYKLEWNSNEQIQFKARLLNSNNELFNRPDVILTVTDSIGAHKTYTFNKANNTYQLNIGMLNIGKYSYTAQCSYNNQVLKDIGRFVVSSNSLEDLEYGCNYAFLNSWAKNNNGSCYTLAYTQNVAKDIENNAQIKPTISEQNEQLSIIEFKWIFVILLLIASTEWLLRKYWLS